MAEYQGFSSVTEKYVCEDCIDDYAIQEFIRENATRNRCDYCGSEAQKLIAADLDSVIKFMLEGIQSEWGDPFEVGNIYDSEDGKWFVPVCDSRDLISGLQISIWEDALEEDICTALSDYEWCPRNPLGGSDSERLIWGWNDFAEQVKYCTRYIFFRTKSPSFGYSPEIDPSDMLDELSKVISEIGLVRPLEIGAEVFRARAHNPRELLTTAGDLGPPPRDCAKYSNRMSPAGIPMFYGAFDEQTTLAEIDNPTVATIGTFRVLQEMLVIDLTVLPQVPSLFDPHKRHERPSIMFLHAFAEEVSRSIEKDERERIEYVPTQVFTEYFRHLYRDSEGKGVQGILYKSAQNEGGKSCVLFLENKHCCDTLKGDESDKEKWLQLSIYP
jgi:hypothetical protein